MNPWIRDLLSFLLRAHYQCPWFDSKSFDFSDIILKGRSFLPSVNVSMGSYAHVLKTFRL